MNQNPEQTQTQAPEASKTKMVKIKTIRDIRLMRPIAIGPMKGTLAEEIVPAGKTLEVSEEEAKEFCDKIFEGSHAYVGDRYEADGEVTKFKIRRAERVKA